MKTSNYQIVDNTDIDGSGVFCGWDVADKFGSYITEIPFKTKAQALAFAEECNRHDAEAESNDRYWQRVEAHACGETDYSESGDY